MSIYHFGAQIQVPDRELADLLRNIARDAAVPDTRAGSQVVGVLANALDDRSGTALGTIDLVGVGGGERRVARDVLREGLAAAQAAGHPAAERLEAFMASSPGGV